MVLKQFNLQFEEKSTEKQEVDKELKKINEIIDNQDIDMLAKLLLKTHIMKNSYSTGLYYRSNSIPNSLPDLHYWSGKYRFPTLQQTKTYLSDYSVKWFTRNINEINDKSYSNNEEQLISHIKDYWNNNLDSPATSEDRTVRPFSELN